MVLDGIWSQCSCLRKKKEAEPQLDQQSPSNHLSGRCCFCSSALLTVTAGYRSSCSGGDEFLSVQVREEERGHWPGTGLWRLSGLCLFEKKIPADSAGVALDPRNTANTNTTVSERWCKVKMNQSGFRKRLLYISQKLIKPIHEKHTIWIIWNKIQKLIWS